MGKRSILRACLWFLVAGYSAYLVGYVAARPEQLQWDFGAYYIAAGILKDGGNPYAQSPPSGQPDRLQGVPEFAKELKYLYPPVTLRFFVPFTALDYGTASRVWLGIKTVLLAWLVGIWLRHFLLRALSPGLLLILILAFDSAIYWDLKAGNVSLIEQMLLWLAFLQFLRRRLFGFVFLLLLASMFKASLLMFLLLPLVCGDRRALWALVGGGVAAGAWVGLNFLVDAGVFRAYLHGIPSLAETNDHNFGSLDFFHDLILPRVDNVLVRGLPFLAYFGWLAVVVYTLREVPFRLRASSDEGRRLLILLACAVYAAVVPRLMCYSLILMIVPAYHAFVTAQGRATPWLILLLLIPVNGPLPDDPFLSRMARYLPLFLAVVTAYLLRNLALNPEESARRPEITQVRISTGASPK